MTLTAPLLRTGSPLSHSDETNRSQFDPEVYDAWFDQPWGRYASALEHAALSAELPEHARRALDVGCGTGRLAVAPPGALRVGVDRDEDMLALARDRVRGPVVLADAEHLPFATSSFDLSTAVTLCEFTCDAAGAITELARVTRPGGRVVIGALNRRSPWGWLSRRQFSAPPWSAARLLPAPELVRLASRHGTVRIRTVLFAPAAWAGLRWWGPLLERLGHLVASRGGAFVVLSITRGR